MSYHHFSDNRMCQSSKKIKCNYITITTTKVSASKMIGCICCTKHHHTHFPNGQSESRGNYSMCHSTQIFNLESRADGIIPLLVFLVIVFSG